MTELERYICDNREEFDSVPVPGNSRERFMSTVAAERRKNRIRFISIASTGIAAAFGAFVALSYDGDMEKVLEHHHRRMAEKELDIMTHAEANNPFGIDEVINTIRSITFEAIPLEDQLPDELSAKEKIRILNEYYDQKYDALENLLAQL